MSVVKSLKPVIVVLACSLGFSHSVYGQNVISNSPIGIGAYDPYFLRRDPRYPTYGIRYKIYKKRDRKRVRRNYSRSSKSRFSQRNRDIIARLNSLGYHMKDPNKQIGRRREARKLIMAYQKATGQLTTGRLTPNQYSSLVQQTRRKIGLGSVIPKFPQPPIVAPANIQNLEAFQ